MAIIVVTSTAGYKKKQQNSFDRLKITVQALFKSNLA